VPSPSSLTYFSDVFGLKFRLCWSLALPFGVAPFRKSVASRLIGQVGVILHMAHYTWTRYRVALYRIYLGTASATNLKCQVLRPDVLVLEFCSVLIDFSSFYLVIFTIFSTIRTGTLFSLGRLVVSLVSHVDILFTVRTVGSFVIGFWYRLFL
jgi:hypothetical protein